MGQGDTSLEDSRTRMGHGNLVLQITGRTGRRFQTRGEVKSTISMRTTHILKMEQRKKLVTQ